MERVEHTVDDVLQNEGIVYARRCRSTGTIIGLYDNRRTDQFDPDGGRWVTLCEDHSNLVNHETRRLAEAFMSDPGPWCEECQAIIEAKDLPAEPEVDDSNEFDDGLVYVHQGRTAIVMTGEQARRLGARLVEIAS